MSTHIIGKTIEGHPTSSITKVCSVATGKLRGILARIEMAADSNTDVATVMGGRNLNTTLLCIRQVSVVHPKVVNAVRVTVLITTTNLRRGKFLWLIRSSSTTLRIEGQRTANFSSTRSHHCNSCSMTRVEPKESNTPKEANSFPKLCMAAARRVFQWLTQD